MHVFTYLVDTSVNDVEVLVDLPFILMLKDFAMNSIKPLTSPRVETEPTKSTDVEDAGVLPSSSPVLSATPKSPSPVEQSTVSDAKDVAQGKMTIRAQVKKPLIALVEEAEEKDSRALVLLVSIRNLLLWC